MSALTRLLVLGLLLSHPARAQLCTASVTALVFGIYDPSLATPSDIAGSVSVNCVAVTPAAVSYAIQLGAGGSGSYTARSLAGAGTRLTYNIFTDPARSTVWGDGTGGSVSVRDAYMLGTGGSGDRSYTAYGRILAGQRIAPGAYADVLTVLVSY